MAIVNATIKASIGTLIDQTSQLEPAQAKEQFAQGLANIIETAIKSGTVTVSAGIAVQVAVPAGTGATTAPGTGTIS
jgi:translation initiation factor 2 alpha subunit (eIF-2alpha)